MDNLWSESESSGQAPETFSSDVFTQESNKDDISQKTKKNYLPISDDD